MSFLVILLLIISMQDCLFKIRLLLDTSCSGSFTRNKEEFKRDLLDRIQENTEGWENDKDRESGINFDYKCIEVFMDTDKFRNISATYGLDSQVVANLYKAFASHYELPKKNFDKYHEPYKDKIDSSINKCVVIETVDHVIPEAYIEKTPFPAKMKEYSVISSAVNKSAKKPIEPEEQIKVEPAIAIVKDLVTENVEDGHIIFCEDASNIVSHPNKSRKTSVPMLSVRIGDHCYYGLCDIGASISAIPYELYTEIMHEIGSCELEDIDVVIRLANRETISPIGIVRDVEVLCGKIKYPADFLVLGSAASKYCPIIFGRPFLNTCGAVIDCKKEKIVTKFAGESYEFNFSKFAKTPYKADLPNNDFRVEQCASIALAPNNPLQQHLENSESEVFREERNELDEIFLRQPILKHDLPVEDLGTTPPPKEDPVFDLKPLPDDLKYAHIDDKKIYPVIISSKLSEIEEERLLEILKKHRGAIGYTLDDLKGISPSICQHAINMEDDAKPVVEHQRRLIPKMKDVVRNEVLKLLEAGIIYPIADSRWVSPVYCVPKKGGMTVVPNDNDELIPQRVVVGRMPFGLCNAPATFQRCMSAIFHGFCESIVERCEETNLVLNWEKCHFMVNEGIVLGHKISERGIEVDRAKVEAIEKMPYPRDVKGIRSVLGHAGFYRRFIKDFSKISKPLTNLLQKDVPFVFDDDCKEAFETLKKALTTAPVVEPPDWNLPFEIMCDASDFAVGAVLGQRVDKKLNVIHYASKTLDAATEKELLAVVFAYRKGADNPVADNLSRLENIAYDPVPVNDSFPNEQLAAIKDASDLDPPCLVGNSKDSFFEDVVNPYMNELKMHPKELLLVDGELQIKDVQGPKGEGSLEDRMEKLEQEVFNYKKMAEREVDIFHKIVSELIDGHKKETAKLWDDIFSLHDTTNKLQAQLYDVNQSEYENRFKRISYAASFRFPETKMSFVDGEPLPWKSDDGKDSPSSPKSNSSSMNRQWMYGDRCHPDFINGMHYFLNVAEANRQSNGFIYCPCSSCKNMTDYSTSKTIHVHLLQNGFMPSYNCWTKHGERGIILEDNEEEEDSDNYPMFTEDGDSRMGEDEAEEEPIFDEPIFDDPDDDLGRAILDAKISCGSEKERLKLQKMLEDHKTLLYPNCEDGQKKLGTTLELLQWKAENGTSDKGFEKLLKIIKKMLPGENVLPSSTYEAKKVVCPLGLEVQKIHACINDCILYRGEYENLNACPVCSALRYKIRRDDPGDVEGESTPRKRVPAKVMWPEGSISKGYGTEEVIEFCVDFIPDLKPIGVPESRYEGRLRGKGTLGKKAITCMDGHSFTQAHYTVLHNSILVAPYKEEHKDILRSKYPEEREDWIDGEHMKTFGGWLQTRLMNATDDEQLYLLAKQPSSTISTFQGYEINGNTFYTFAQDKKSTNQNSGVRFDAADDNGKKVTYYGYIEEIWELEYGPNFKVPLFRCKWFNLKDGVQVDPQYGMTTVDLKNLGHDAASTLSSSFEQGVMRYMLYLIEQGVLIMPTALVPVAPTSRY
ncbi:hypothetical protein QYE76_038172 [Lolium multiflorum]|uniref:Uncharacterized protein n=1 Tax=Lolium multiflorum TaxID=4521 RepID=A0AAD8T8Q5_LOLMU|nr:hypothetical protein QYE76_038172 [Lolium multiflorum]